MANQSPSYVHIPIEKALVRAKQWFDADRTNVIDRASAANHIGYSSLSGAADKMLGTLAQYGLAKSAGKGQVCMTPLAMDVFVPDSEDGRRAALWEAGNSPPVFKMINDHFESPPSESSLRNWLIRANFQDRAILPIMKSYFRTMDYLEREKAIVSGGPSAAENAKEQEPEATEVPGGANIGDSIQWERDGIFQLESPLRVRHVSSDGAWVFVEGSETGIPMQETIVRARTDLAPPAFVPPPVLPLEPKKATSTAQNQFNIVQAKGLLQIDAENVTASGLRALRKKLEIYQTLMDLNTEDLEPSEDVLD